MSENKYLGCGVYSFGQAARLLKVPQTSLRYWIGERPGAESIVKRELADDRLLTFAELMELHFVKMFRDEKVTYQAIRKAAAAAARKFHTNYPFTVKRFDTDGTHIFATLEGKETKKKLIEELKHGQLVFTKFIRPFFKKLDYGTVDIEKFWPLKKSGRVVLDPMRRYGQPIDNETGISTAAIFEAVTAGDGQDVNIVAKWFGIPQEAVRAAVRFERSLAS